MVVTQLESATKNKDTKKITEYKQRYIRLEDEIPKQKAKVVLKNNQGPVGETMDSILQKNNIDIQAYHARSMVGNHCATYIKKSVTTSINSHIKQKVSKVKDKIWRTAYFQNKKGKILCTFIVTNM